MVIEWHNNPSNKVSVNICTSEQGKRKGKKKKI